MTKRFARAYRWLLAKSDGRRQIVLIIIGLWIAVELTAVAVVAIAGKQWFEAGAASSRSSERSAPPGPRLAAWSGPSLTIF